MVGNYKLPIAQKVDENWGHSNIYIFFKEWEFLNARVIACVSSPDVGIHGKGYHA